MLSFVKDLMSRGRTQVEDVVARAFCLAGQPHEARAHCKAAIQVLVATSVMLWFSDLV